VERSLVVAATCLSLLVAGGCSAGKPVASTPPQNVETIVATNGAVTPALQIAGVIVPYRQIGVAADLTEPLMEVDVQEGDYVHAGQVLGRLLVDDLEAQLASAEHILAEDKARYFQIAYQVRATNALDQSAIASARAVLHQDEVNLAGAVVDLNRYVTLVNQGYLAGQTADEQRTTVASDQSAVVAAQAALNQAIANAQANGVGTNAGVQLQELAADREAVNSAEASIVQLQRQIARAVIVAPAEGIIDAVNANPGEYPTQRQLFTIEQNATVYAVLPASTLQVTDVRQGASATITVPNRSGRLVGRVVAVLDQVAPGTTNFTVKVQVDNHNGKLHAGMPANATVDLPSVSGVKVPLTAFVDDTHRSVYSVRGGTVHTLDVSYLSDDGTNAIVRGLRPGTVIVRDVESSTVGDGDAVAVITK
jgi:multidrug efflux pump subunit AcrA (membrane-fusion protein)